MRLALFGDVHANLPAMEACWRELSAVGFDLAICTGDLVQYGPFPGEVVGFFRDREIACVQGNCDRAVGRQRSGTGDSFREPGWRLEADHALEWTASVLGEGDRSFLRSLPEERRFQAGRTTLLVTHGLPGRVSAGFEADTPPDSADVLLRSNDCQVMVLGHTHSPLLVTRESGWIINPGSIGGGTLPAASTVAVLEVDEKRGPAGAYWVRAEWDVKRYTSAYRNAGLPELFLKCILLGRDPRGEWHTDDIRWRQRWAEHL